MADFVEQLGLARPLVTARFEVQPAFRRLALDSTVIVRIFVVFCDFLSEQGHSSWLRADRDPAKVQAFEGSVLSLRAGTHRWLRSSREAASGPVSECALDERRAFRLSCALASIADTRQCP